MMGRMDGQSTRNQERAHGEGSNSVDPAKDAACRCPPLPPLIDIISFPLIVIIDARQKHHHGPPSMPPSRVTALTARLSNEQQASSTKQAPPVVATPRPTPPRPVLRHATRQVEDANEDAPAVRADAQ